MRIHTETLTGRTAFLDEADSFPGLSLKHRWMRSLVGARFLIRRRRYDEATLMLAEYGETDSTSPGLGVARLVDTAHLAASIGDARATAVARNARDAARRQRAHRSRRIADLLIAFSRLMKSSRLPSPQSERRLLGTSPTWPTSWSVAPAAWTLRAVDATRARDGDASSPLASSSEIRARLVDRASETGRWTPFGVDWGAPQTSADYEPQVDR